MAVTPMVEEGETVSAIVVFKDITERKKLQNQLLQINEELEMLVKQEIEARQKQELLTDAAL